jgi:hypothetical protein
MEISVPQMKLLEAASLYGTQSRRLFNEKVKASSLNENHYLTAIVLSSISFI